MLLLCVQCLQQYVGCLERGVRRPYRVRVAAEQSALLFSQFLDRELHHVIKDNASLGPHYTVNEVKRLGSRAACRVIPYADPDLEMLYSYGRFLLPHLPRDRDGEVIKLGDEVALQYYRLERIFSGPIMIKEGEEAYVKSPTDVGTGKARDEDVPLSEIISVLNNASVRNSLRKTACSSSRSKRRLVRTNR